MRIFLISNLYPSKKFPFYGTFVKQFEDSMIDQGCKIPWKVVLTKQSDFLLKIVGYFRFFFEVIWISLFGKYDILYAHYANHSLFPLFFVKFLIKRPIVVNAHGGDIFHESKFAKVIWFFSKHVVKNADLIVVPSNYFKAVIVRKLNIKELRIIVSPSGGIDSKKFNWGGKSLYNQNLQVGYLGRIDFGKGYDTLLQAFALLRKTYDIAANLKVAGGGKEIDKFLKMVDFLNLSRSVEYQGLIPHEKVKGFFDKIDVLVFPSKRQGESLGLVPLEALACGKPVIAFKNGAVDDYILDGENGFLYLKDDPALLAELIYEYSNLSEQKREEMSQIASETAKKYDSVVVASKLYKQLLFLVCK